MGISILFFLSCLSVCYAKTVKPASILINTETGQILAGEQINALWHPASLTKLMTLYIAFEDLQRGELKLADKIKLSQAAVIQSENRTGLAPGNQLRLEDAIFATILISANDAATAIAEHIGGSEAAFAERMNETAKKLGMTRTHFINATGLPDEQQVTTARDLALLALSLYKDFPTYYKYFGTVAAKVVNRPVHNINPILSSYRGADGMKTGFTCASGYNLIASVHRDGTRLIAVLLGGADPEERLQKMTALLNKGFEEMPNPWLQKITDPITIPAEEEGPPPNVLSGTSCITGHGAGPAYSLSGWAVILGAFPSRGQASQQIANSRKMLGAVMPAGQASIIRRTYEGVTRHNAMITGITQKQAGDACKALWAKGGYCLALAPTTLRNASLPWR